MEQPKRGTKELRVFAIGIFIITGLIGAFLFYKDKMLASYILGGFSAYGLVSIPLPILITPLFIVFSYLGMALGWFNTRLLLGIIFYLVFTPIGLIFRLFKRDELDLAIDKSAETYWTDVQHLSEDPARYEKQF